MLKISDSVEQIFQITKTIIFFLLVPGRMHVFEVSRKRKLMIAVVVIL